MSDGISAAQSITSLPPPQQEEVKAAQPAPEKDLLQKANIAAVDDQTKGAEQKPSNPVIDSAEKKDLEL